MMTDPPTETPIDTIGYADALAELDEILEELDDDRIDIDVLGDRVERAAKLIAVCRNRIASAQATVEQIVGTLERADGTIDHAGGQQSD